MLSLARTIRIVPWILLLWGGIFGCCFAQNLLPEKPKAKVSLLFPSLSVQPGSEIEGIIECNVLSGWHLYWKNPGEVGLAPTFDWKLPQGVSVQDIEWPAPVRFQEGRAALYGYNGTVQWVVRLKFDKSVPEGMCPIELSTLWLACDGECVPGSQKTDLTFIVSKSAPVVQQNPTFLQEAKQHLPIPLSGSEASLEKSVLCLTLPVSVPADIKEIILFPQQQGLFPPERLPKWGKNDDNHLQLMIECSDIGKAYLLQNLTFSGIVQIIPKKGPSLNYSITTPLSIMAQPLVEVEKEKGWKLPLSQSITPDMTFILLAAFLGGMILNVTPCVLPIVGLKILHLFSFRQSGKPIALHGVAFLLGSLTAFWALAGSLYFLEYIGSTIGWGFQLQEPLFVAVLILGLFVFAMNLFGLFEIGVSVSAWAANVEQGIGAVRTPTYAASYVSGLLATVIATPCTGPLLGSVLGFAITFQPLEGFLIFTAIGVGAAFPFLVITLCPPLLRLLPKPGAWMTTLKQFFGFCVVATILWLLWVLEAETRGMSLLLAVVGLTFFAVALWILGHWATPARSFVCRFLARIIALVISIVGIGLFFFSFDSSLHRLVDTYMPRYKTIAWKSFSRPLLEQELRDGHTVFVKFTAKWCIICQTNQVVFLSPEVVDAFERHEIVPLEADWTNGDEEITEMLRSIQRNGVPVYAVFRPGKAPVLLPEIITVDEVVESIKNVGE
jgi:thiol:disulfide interchange protein DsbD